MKAKEIWFDGTRIYLRTDDGRVGSLWLKSFPRLYNATYEQRKNFTLGSFGIHRPELDEDLNYEGFFDEKAKTPANKVAELFISFPELNIHQTARAWGYNQSLISKYNNVLANPSQERIREIKEKARRLGEELIEWSK